MDPTQKRTIQKRTISPRSWYRYEGQSQVGEFSRGGRLRCFEPLRALDHDMEPDVLESHWSGALLTDLDAVREWTKTMRWDGIAPNVYFLNREYHRGVKLTAREMKSYSMRLLRTPLIERWSLFIHPPAKPCFVSRRHGYARIIPL